MRVVDVYFGFDICMVYEYVCWTYICVCSILCAGYLNPNKKIEINRSFMRDDLIAILLGIMQDSTVRGI